LDGVGHGLPLDEVVGPLNEEIGRALISKHAVEGVEVDSHPAVRQANGGTKELWEKHADKAVAAGGLAVGVRHREAVVAGVRSLRGTDGQLTGDGTGD